MSSLISAEMPLGLNLIEVLFHLLNICILVIAVRFLLYKPIKKFMAKRAELYKEKEAETEKYNSEAQELKEKYEKLVSDANSEAMLITKEAALVASAQADAIINQAKTEATAIFEKAESDIALRTKDEKDAVANAIVELAVDISNKVLSREFRQKDNDKIIDRIIDEWKNSDA
jgi:F-type H+-transporting ATPase subunit b